MGFLSLYVERLPPDEISQHRAEPSDLRLIIFETEYDHTVEKNRSGIHDIVLGNEKSIKKWWRKNCKNYPSEHYWEKGEPIKIESGASPVMVAFQRMRDRE